MIETYPFSIKEQPGRDQSRLYGQVLRFGLVGGLNTLVDILFLNGLLWAFPTTSTLMLLTYNSLAYSLGAVNSFLLNKYWTFGARQKTARGELARFTLTTLCGMGWSSAILWLAGVLLHPYLGNATLWTNTSKVVAIAGTVLISYLGMRLWVFVYPDGNHTINGDHKGRRYDIQRSTDEQTVASSSGYHSNQSAIQSNQGAINRAPTWVTTSHSLSLVLPAYNEEAVIGATLTQVLHVLTKEAQLNDFEVIVVNDGSTDGTGAIVSAIAENEPQVRLVTHERNQGYGATLADGFAAATKELTLFMDSDGQFDLHDLARLLPFIDEYDAVLGYRLHRQDTWMRKLNAWGWKTIIRCVLGIRVRDIDCAFKLLHTHFLHSYPLETRGAMINAELLYKLKRAGYTYREVGVRHLPRQGGRATGANLRVIIRAFRELFIFAHKWRRENSVHAQQILVP